MSHLLQIRISDAHWTLIKAAATQIAAPVTTWARMEIVKGAREALGRVKVRHMTEPSGAETDLLWEENMQLAYIHAKNHLAGASVPRIDSSIDIPARNWGPLYDAAEADARREEKDDASKWTPPDPAADFAKKMGSPSPPPPSKSPPGTAGDVTPSKLPEPPGPPHLTPDDFGRQHDGEEY